MPLQNTARRSSRATILCDGSVLLAGGFEGSDVDTPVSNSAEVYNPQLGTWKEVGPMLTERTQHTVTLLSDCDVILIGGQKNGATDFILNSASLFIQSDLSPEEEQICIPIKAANETVALICL